jgi:type II secretory pathway pseudopilin PulG
MKRILNARIGREDRGFALIIVVTIGAVLMILATVAITAAISGTMKARQDQSWSAALSAAYAAIDEYQSRLSNDSFYVQYGNPDADFSEDSDVTLPTGTQENPAFGIGTTGTWATVAGSGGTAKFRYEVNTSDYFDTGVIQVRATGLVNGVTRSVIADLRQTGFIDFLYFTDYEIQDPEISGEGSGCVKYEWAGRSSSCTSIQFGKNDVINGPLHSNDTLLICESEFNGNVTTSNSQNKGSGRLYLIPSGCGTADFKTGIGYAPTVGMPATNSQMKRETRSDLKTQGVPSPGCLYTGPTSIVFNSDGTMTVKSPWTKKTQVTGDPNTGGSTPAMCGTTTALRSSSGATITVPDRNLVYVQNVPTVSSDPNYWSKNESGQPSCKKNGNPLGYPISKEYSSSSAYGCKNGDLFVQGTLKGQVTLAAENYVYVTGDIVYKDSSTDILGLVGNNAVWVWNPMDDDGDKLLSGSNREIDAAILSVAHTFQVQNYKYTGKRGDLTIKGAIAQKFRGPVGTSSGGVIVNGYVKDYNYDPRLKYTAPPKFLSPVTTTYGVTTWMDTPAAMNADGSYR